jgi:conjugative transfer region protein TrbK
MLGRSDLLRAAAIVVLIAAFIVTLAAINRRRSAPVDSPPTTTNPASDDLSAELRRCRTLGPRDAEDARCAAVWEENRRRFFGRLARPLPPPTQEGGAAPANAPTAPAPGDAR